MFPELGLKTVPAACTSGQRSFYDQQASTIIYEPRRPRSRGRRPRTICLDVMVDCGDIRSIEPLKHKIHTKCIKMWHNTQISGNTCLICRYYVAKEDEFPDLSATR